MIAAVPNSPNVGPRLSLQLQAGPFFGEVLASRGFSQNQGTYYCQGTPWSYP
jgi:hypothetical protein